MGGEATSNHISTKCVFGLKKIHHKPLTRRLLGS
jgi:hypothetical protein